MSRIYDILDESLSIINTARDFHATLVEWPNVLIHGLTGSGKTAITKAWAKEKGILLVPYDLSRDVTIEYVEDKFGILRKQKVKDPVMLAKWLIFDTLIKYKDSGDFILFLDDIHLATKENLEAIYYTMDNHEIYNPMTNETVYLDNMLFTISIKTDMI